MKNELKMLGVAIIALACLGSGRGCVEPVAKVDAFKVTPRLVCPGDAVTITWNTVAFQTFLESSPPVEPPLPTLSRPSISSETRTVTQTTTFTVRAQSGARVATSMATAEVVPPGGGAVFLEIPGVCDRGVARWELGIPAGEYSPNLVIHSVENLTGRPVVVTHHDSGRTFQLGIGGTSTEADGIAGKPLLSAWGAAVMDLSALERCPPPGTTHGSGPTPRLPPVRLLVRYGCP